MPNLIQCLDCERDISPSAEFCPHCGCTKDSQLEAILHRAQTVSYLDGNYQKQYPKKGKWKRWQWKEGWVKCFTKDGILDEIGHCKKINDIEYRRIIGFYLTGTKKLKKWYEQFYENDMLHGLQTSWYFNPFSNEYDKKKKEVTYSKGVLHGSFYDEHIGLVGHYSNGKRVGKWVRSVGDVNKQITTWYDDVITDIVKLDQKLEVYRVTCNNNAIIRVSLNLLPYDYTYNGTRRIRGRLINFDNFIKNPNYKRSKPISICEKGNLKPNYKSFRSKDFKNFLSFYKIGLWTAFYENGRKYSQGEYEVGEEYYPAPNQGRKVGNWIYWFPNGVKCAEGRYAMKSSRGKSKMIGKWKFWNEDGELQYVMKFKNNELQSTEDCLNGGNVDIITAGFNFVEWLGLN